MEDFDSGFTEMSYFNIFKEIALSIYEKYARGGKLNFKYRDNEKINASVEYNEMTGEDILVVNVGTITEIFAMMKTAFAQRDVLDKISFSQDEDNKIIDGKFIPFNCSIIYNGGVVNPNRNSLADYTSIVALRFIFAHELGHILNGHTQLLKSLYMDSRIDMRLENIDQNQKYCLDRRTLEMDADAAAATNSIDNIIMLYCEHRNNDIFSLFTEPEDIFSIWGFAVSCIFFKFEKEKKTIYKKDSCYLPNAARLMLILDSAHETAKSYVSHNVVSGLLESKDKIDKALLYGIEQARYFFKKCYYVDYHWIENINKGEYWAFSKEVLENWNENLFYKLTPYSRAPLYLPSKVDKTMERLKKQEKSKKKVRALCKILYKAKHKFLNL